MERVRIGKDIVFQWEVRKDGAALTEEDAANLTLEIAGRNGKSQRLPFEIRDSKIIAAWYGVKQTEVGACRLTCWHNRGKVGESVVDVVWAVELVRYTTEESFDDLETVTIELEGGNLTFAALKGASAYEVAVAEGFVGTEAEWIASLKKPAEDAAEDAEEAAARAIEAAENAETAVTRAETAAQSAENAAGDANAAAGLANSAAGNAEAKAQLADAAADNASIAATEAYSKAQEADTAATTATNAAQSANSAAASANEAANSAVEAAVEATESAENAQAQADNAHYAANHANEMAIGAERVNAQLNGNILTVTNRQGTSTSVNTQGEQGNPGQAATISVGTTSTGAPGTSAQVTNSGTASAAVLDFTIPQGAKGDKGPQGEPGEVTEAELDAALALKEDLANKVTEIDDDSTDVQYPSAKGVWTAIKNAISAIKQWAMSLFARTDGYYSRMIVGGAESVIGKESDLDAATDYVVQGGTGIAKVNEVMGRSEKWNQILNIADEAKTDGGITHTISNLKITATGTKEDSREIDIRYTFSTIDTHVYLIWCNDRLDCNSLIINVGGGSASISPPAKAIIKKATITSNSRYVIFRYNGTGYEISGETYLHVFDLTDDYGAGNEPTAVEQFEADVFAKYGKTLDEYFAYDAGSINNANVEKLDITGFNQWDEQWELGGISADGVLFSRTDAIRCKNFIKVLPNVDYYFKSPIDFSNAIACYDKDYNFVSGLSVYANRIKTIPSNVVYIKIALTVSYGTTYNHDICINISDATKNGTYEPYRHIELPVNIKTITGKVNGEGESVTIFPNGVRGVGTAYDSLIVDEDGWARRAIVRMASRAYQEGDASNTSVLTDGTTTIYALATPIEYVLDTPILMTFNAYNGGVIRQIKGDIELATRMNIAFALNVEGFVNGASKEYINAASMQGFLSVLGTRTGGTWAMTWDEANKKYNFTFTPS